MTAIEVRDVSKVFRLQRDPTRSIKERLLRRGVGNAFENFTALSGIDLDVSQGETLGLLGHNGSGKSTLLKCIAGIILPTTGTIRMRGRLASLLELGAGFHPELTGRENIFVNASFLGIPRKEIEQRVDEIVAFAELEQFIDNQVKYYSSGMYVRLGFAVAVNVDPDVLLVDEVLAVGDEAFQAKCLTKIRSFQADGRTIVFVTHGADMVRQLCNRAVVLHHGHMVANGAPGESIRIFREHLHGHAVDATVAVDEPSAAFARDPRVQLTSVTMDHPGRPDRPYLIAGEPLTITVAYEASTAVAGTVLEIEVYDGEGRVLFGADTDRLGAELPALVGTGEVRLEIDAVPLLDGGYPVGITLRDRATGDRLDWRDPEQQSFEVVNTGRVNGTVSIPMRVSVSDSTPITG